MEEIVFICVVIVKMDIFVIRKLDVVFWVVLLVMREFIVIKVNNKFLNMCNIL